MQPPDLDFETYQIMGGISNLNVKQAMAERLIANVNVQKVNKISIPEKQCLWHRIIIITA